ncbi:hypothetical protein BDQ12DRAFT_725293 [Crucibulum laeve]|uniref:HNH nuclease domain-containing protein n=1 Tax=Crucibulum laeve TaxID=68775 RepID=A0A5C3LUK7_9AGAR|nr:hypothetical protein BDQ12DRAFT_725293 [Crucibulum laeve]
MSECHALRFPSEVPLPENTQTVELPKQAYDACKKFEAFAEQVDTPAPSIGAPLSTRARFMGYLILETPLESSRETIAKEILDCSTNEDIAEIAQQYIDRFACCFRNNRTHLFPTSNDPSSRPPVSSGINHLRWLQEDRPEEVRVKTKARALHRDRHCCLITGAQDISIFDEHSPLSQGHGGSLNPRKTSTHPTHILSRPKKKGHTVQPADDSGPEVNTLFWSFVRIIPQLHFYMFDAWIWVMLRFGGIDVVNELNEENIHKLDNVLTLDRNVHASYSSLQTWLEAMVKLFLYESDFPVINLQQSTPDKYTVKTLHPYQQHDIKDNPITFTSSDPNNFPVPSPTYLGLHAAIARVFHLSGAEAYISRVTRNLHRIGTLASDGSSADVLRYVLSQVSLF